MHRDPVRLKPVQLFEAFEHGDQLLAGSDQNLRLLDRERSDRADLVERDISET